MSGRGVGLTSFLASSTVIRMTRFRFIKHEHDLKTWHVMRRELKTNKNTRYQATGNINWYLDQAIHFFFFLKRVSFWNPAYLGATGYGLTEADEKGKFWHSCQNNKQSFCFIQLFSTVMEKRIEFWAEKWEAKDAPWHKNGVNEYLINHFARAVSETLRKPCRVFVPLCGKSHDLKWYVNNCDYIFLLLVLNLALPL